MGKAWRATTQEWTEEMREIKKVRGINEQPPGSGIWWIQYFDAAGKRRREKAGTRADALDLYKKRKTEALQGKKLPEKLRSVARISDLAPALLRDYRLKGQKSSSTVQRRLRLHVLPFFGTTAANELGSDRINFYIDNRLEEGAANATTNHEFAALKRIYNLARACDPPKVDRVPKFPHLKESEPRQGFIEDDQYDLLVQHASELWLRAILEVAYSFGFRREELLQHLKVGQVDLRNRSIRLNAGTTKNGKGRVVKMTSKVESLLKECIAGKQAHDYVFTRADP
jgi:integrase